MGNIKKSKQVKRRKSSNPKAGIRALEMGTLAPIKDQFPKLSFVLAISDRPVKWNITANKKCKAITAGSEVDADRAPYFILEVAKDAIAKLFPHADIRPEHERMWDQLYMQLIPWRKSGYEQFEIRRQLSKTGCMIYIAFSKNGKEKGMPFYFNTESDANNFEAYARPFIKKINTPDWNK